MEVYPVSTVVNNLRNETKERIGEAKSTDARRGEVATGHGFVIDDLVNVTQLAGELRWNG